MASLNVAMDSLNKAADFGPSGNMLGDGAIELGVYFFAVTACMFYLLDRVHGKIDRLNSWLVMRKLEVFK